MSVFVDIMYLCPMLLNTVYFTVNEGINAELCLVGIVEVGQV